MDIELQKLHPVFASKVEQLLKNCQSHGLIVGIHKGLRTFAEQEALYKKRINGKRVTLARPGMSWHNYGLAVDIVFKDCKISRGSWCWGDHHPWKQLGSLGIELGLTWGGNFKKLYDAPHFEWHPGLKIVDVLKLYNRFGLKSVWTQIKEE